jgi:hypothetical protein
MPNDELEETQKKINALKDRLDALTERTFAYFTAIFQLLEDRGLLEGEELVQRLEWHKKQFAKIFRDVEFYRLMLKQFGDDESAPPEPSD